MLEIDGSFGEAGGQILRTSLSLSCILNRPFRIFNIRKNRKKPGLMPQHLMAVRALAQISNAHVRGDYQGSTEIHFKPSETRPGHFIFDIGTAGSTSLLLQAVLPPLVFANGVSSVVLKGGTHVPFSPPFHYLSKVFVPTLRRIGIDLEIAIQRYGFYPRGGGEITVNIPPFRSIHGGHLTARGKRVTLTGISGVANLPLSIAERQKNAALTVLSRAGIRAEMTLLNAPSFGRGTFLFLGTEGDCFAGFSSLGERGKKAETVGEEAAGEFLGYYHTSACLDHYLPDQLLLYLALAKGSSSFSTCRITNHLMTNVRVVEDFLGPQVSVEGEMGEGGTVRITGSSTVQ